MFHIDLEQGTIGLAFAESGVREFFTGADDDASCSCTNTSGSYDCESDGCSRSHVSSVSSKSEETVCRICKLEVGSYGQSLIELGCSCKEDLAFVHQECAETWFKLKGDGVCEICQSVAKNVECGWRNVASGNEMIEEEEEAGGGGDAIMAEERESWWRRQPLMSIGLCWLLAIIMYFLQSKFKLFSDG